MTKNIKFTNMGVFNGYQIEWINALTGEAIDTTEKISDSFGHLKLEFPDTLTGNATCPIMFFKLYPIDDTFLAPIANDSVGIKDNQFIQVDSDIESIEETDWDQNLINTINKNDFKIEIKPNPTQSIINVNITGLVLIDGTWTLTDTEGKIIRSSKLDTANFLIDLSVYPAGQYYLIIQSGQNKLTNKIIKL